MTTPPGSPDPADVEAIVAAARDRATALDRGDLADRLGDIAARLARTDTVVCVVGEFKKGKSALINALLGAPVCPVDDDLATTTVTVVRYADEPSVTVRRREEGRLLVEQVPPDDLPRWVSETEDDERPSGVEVVEVGLVNPFLARGIALVDTPGVGGLNAAHAAATLAFLPSADALVFVTDASAELSAPELAFLRSALSAGPPILIALTKVDIYPAWRRIAALDEGHLRRAGVVETPVPLSAVLQADGVALGDASLEEESGYPRFADALVEDAAGRARVATIALAAAVVLPVLDQLREPLVAELAVIEDPEAAKELAGELAAARARLDALADADATWSARLEDDFTALRNRVQFDFGASVRHLLRESQDEIERIDPARSWPDVGQRIQQATAAAVQAAFAEATDGAVEIGRHIAELLADEAVGMERDGRPIAFDVAALWERDPAFEGRARSSLVAGFGVLGGAVVGVEMLGMLGTLLGAAVVGPAVLGVVGVFAGKQVLDERRRLLAERRQQARSFVDDFLEEVRFEANGRLGSLLDEIQRQMRGRFADRIRELRRTVAEGAAAIERASEQAADDGRKRAVAVGSELAALDALRERATALDAALR